MVNTSAIALGVALFVSIAAFLYNPIVLRLEVFGVFRQWKGIKNVHGEGLTAIPDLFGVEDFHYHEPTGIIFGLTEENIESRYTWFPPIEAFTNSTDLGHGSLFMLLPDEDHATRIPIAGLPHPFVTHGLDLVTSPSDDEFIYVLAVNHLPNPLATLSPPHPDIPQARSQIELLSYKIGDTEAHYVRSILHPLIRTPNDIFAVSETSFYVTNDHLAREGLSRFITDMGSDDFGANSDIVHITITASELESKDPSAGITAVVALENVQNPNGLGHGRTPGEIMLGRAASGILSVIAPGDKDGKLVVKDQVQLPSTIDNPSYFRDPYAIETGRDASGFVIAGLANAFSLSMKKDARNPGLVWLVQPPGSGEREEREVMQHKSPSEWKQTLIFQDDGERLNTATTAVLVAIPPSENKGRKQAWLVVSGFLASGMYKTKIDL